MAKPPVKTRPSNPPQQVGQKPNEVTVRHASFSGPMPHPSILEGYERIVPGAAERILSMAEADSRHMQEMDKAALAEAAKEIKRGQIFGFSIGLAALGASMLAIAMGAPTVAGVIGGTTVVGLVSVFIVGRVVKAKEE